MRSHRVLPSSLQSTIFIREFLFIWLLCSILVCHALLQSPSHWKGLFYARWARLIPKMSISDYDMHMQLAKSNFNLQEFFWVTPESLSIEVLMSLAERPVEASKRSEWWSWNYISNKVLNFVGYKRYSYLLSCHIITAGNLHIPQEHVVSAICDIFIVSVKASYLVYSWFIPLCLVLC